MRYAMTVLGLCLYKDQLYCIKQERGCFHAPGNTSDLFCAKCGKPTWAPKTKPVAGFEKMDENYERIGDSVGLRLFHANIDSDLFVFGVKIGKASLYDAGGMHFAKLPTSRTVEDVRKKIAAFLKPSGLDKKEVMKRFGLYTVLVESY